MSLPRLCLLVRLNFVAPLPFTVTKPDFNLLICTLQRLDTVLQSVHRKPLVDDQLLDRAEVRPGTVVWGGGGGRWGGRAGNSLSSARDQVMFGFHCVL